MDIINFLFSIHDYNVVGDLFLTDWSMSMVFVCAFVMYIITIPFIFITKKKAKAFCEKYYPNEKILLISTSHEFEKIVMATVWSFGYGYFVLPFIFFKNLNQIAFLTKELMPFFLLSYTFLVFMIMALMVSCAYVLTDRMYRIVLPYWLFIKMAKRKNRLPSREIPYENIKSARYRLTCTGPMLELELVNDLFEKEYSFHKHLKQAQEIIKTYMERNRKTDTEL